uniref:Sodium-dependent glucose transporter 1-like n=1 Tax=Phallusia mammillata TaxID=59560 RepID=A0A6F9DF82_9ASCI|nr:sodium-dependent glucose transporter 1-like [Phallusia mammillata]
MSGNFERKSAQQKKMQYAKTICLCLGFLALGVAIALPGPTLPTLAYNMNYTIMGISFVLPARAVGYLFGSILSGMVLNKLNQQLMIFSSLFVSSIGLVLVPWVKAVLLGVVMSSIGVSMGFLDTGGNVMCLRIWGEKKSEPFMQMLHFSFALGATAAPLIAQPFILDLSNSSLANNVSTTSETQISNVYWAYTIAAALACLVSLSFLVLSCTKAAKMVSNQQNTIKKEGKAFRWTMLGLLFIFFMVYVGMEVAFGLYIFTFATAGATNFSKDQGTALNSVFWGFFAFGRFISIFVSKILSPNGLLRIDLLGTILSTALLLCYPLYSTSAIFLLWVGVALYGLSIASTFPTGISWAEQYITINGRAASTLVVGAALGEMICPLVVGKFVEENPMTLMYFTTGCTGICTVTYMLLQWLASSKGKRNKRIEIEERETTGSTGTEEAIELLNDIDQTNKSTA